MGPESIPKERLKRCSSAQGKLAQRENALITARIQRGKVPIVREEAEPQKRLRRVGQNRIAQKSMPILQSIRQKYLQTSCFQGKTYDQRSIESSIVQEQRELVERYNPSLRAGCFASFDR